MRLIIVQLLMLANLFSQSKIVDIRTVLGDYSINVNKLEVSNTGYYLLDSEERQIVFINNENELTIAGGYGTTEDSFIDPIDILASKLKVYIVDGTENNIVVYDHKLNYLTSKSFNEIYPTLCGIDDWENIYLYSEIENKIFKWAETAYEISAFIDLSNYNINEKSVNHVFVTKSGEIAILTDESISVFNRLGNIITVIPVNQQFENIFKRSLYWYGFDYNNIINLRYNEKLLTVATEKIIDLDYFNDRLYILLENEIRIVDVELE